MSDKERDEKPMISPEETEDTINTEALALAIAEAAWERKALNVRVLDVRGIVSYTDFIVLCHATNDRQAKAIADHVTRELRPVKIRPMGTEGGDSGDWILVDFVDVVFHVFLEETRAGYGLESIYSDAKRMPLEDAPPELEVIVAPVDA